jgi:hypothetical protein
LITVLLLFVSNIFMTLTLSFETCVSFAEPAWRNAHQVFMTKRQALPPMHCHGARLGLYGVMREAIPATSFGRG